MKKPIIFFLLLASFFANGQGTNVFKYLELKNVDTVGLTRVGQFWYNPAVGKFTFHDASGYRHFSPGLPSTNGDVAISSGAGLVSYGLHVDPSFPSSGRITNGIWNGTVVTGQYGGTGVANTGLTITIGGNLSTVNAFAVPANASGVLTNNGSGTLAWAAAGGGSPGGSNTQFQYNNSSAFGGASGLTYNSGTSVVTFSQIPIFSAGVGSATGVTAAGGTNNTVVATNAFVQQEIGTASLGPFSTIAPGYTNFSGNSLAILKGANTWLAPGTALQVLRVNAAATNLEWAAASGTPGGSNTQVQFNNSGVFGGNANFTINNGTGVVTFGQAVTIPLTPVATTDAASKGYVDGFVLPAATATTDGYLTSVDWTAFNNKPNTAWVTNGNTTITANTSQTGAFTNTFSLNGVSITQNALSSSWVSGFKITPGAHTALTAATEFVSADFDAFTWTWNSGTTATERFRFFRSPTINSTSGTATFTNAYNVYIDPPIAGTTAAFTNGPWALGTGGKVSVNVNGLVTTAVVGLRVANNTAATVGVQIQYSPGVDFEGTAWETGSTISAPSIFRLYNKPSTAGSSVGGTMSLDFNGTGSFVSTGFTITQTGGITINNATLSNTGDQAILMADGSGIKWNSVGQLKYTNGTGLNTGTIRINGNGAISATGVGTFVEFGIGNTFSPTSGATDYNTVFFNPVINQTSTASGNSYLLNIKPALTSVLGTITAINYDPVITTVGTHYGIRIVPAVRNAFGLSTATALIHIGAGTATASTGPLKFTAGTLLTTPEAFTVESNANSFYQTKNSTLRYGQGGVIFDNIADANNGTTVETDLYSYTTPANTLAEDGDKVVCSYIGTFNDVTATGQLKVYFGGTAIGNTGALTVSATGGWVAQVLIIRTGSTTARAAVNISTPGASTALYTAETDLTGLTLSGTNIIKITGQAGGASGGSNDITAKFSMGYFFPAAHN